MPEEEEKYQPATDTQAATPAFPEERAAVPPAAPVKTDEWQKMNEAFRERINKPGSDL